MNVEQFELSLRASEPPADMTEQQRALWLEKKGDWDGAHRIVQALTDSLACNIHAYLHRKEPDESNARYWYGRVGIPFPRDKDFDAEWRELLGAAFDER